MASLGLSGAQFVVRRNPDVKRSSEEIELHTVPQLHRHVRVQVKEKMAAMQEAMQKPEVQAQMAEMQSAMANPALQQKLQGMRDDPEFKDMFEDIQKNGMGALMKYMNDAEFLRKLGSRVGDVAPAPGAAGAAAMAAAGSAQQAAAPEVNDLLDAARCAILGFHVATV